MEDSSCLVAYSFVFFHCVLLVPDPHNKMTKCHCCFCFKCCCYWSFIPCHSCKFQWRDCARWWAARNGDDFSLKSQFTNSPQSSHELSMVCQWANESNFSPAGTENCCKSEKRELQWAEEENCVDRIINQSNRHCKVNVSMWRKNVASQTRQEKVSAGFSVSKHSSWHIFILFVSKENKTSICWRDVTLKHLLLLLAHSCNRKHTIRIFFQAWNTDKTLFV